MFFTSPRAEDQHLPNPKYSFIYLYIKISVSLSGSLSLSSNEAEYERMKNKEEFFKEHPYLQEKEVSRSDFPPTFLFGVATSAYQVPFSFHHHHRYVVVDWLQNLIWIFHSFLLLIFLYSLYFCFLF